MEYSIFLKYNFDISSIFMALLKIIVAVAKVMVKIIESIIKGLIFLYAKFGLIPILIILPFLLFFLFNFLKEE